MTRDVVTGGVAVLTVWRLLVVTSAATAVVLAALEYDVW